MNPMAALDSAALGVAASIAEEALVCHREALILLGEGWKSETGSAIKEFMDCQCLCATDVVDALRRVAAGEAPTDVWSDSAGDRVSDAATRLPDPAPPLPDAAGQSAGPVPPTAPPPLIPESLPPWTGQASPSPWSMPPPTDPPWATGPFAGAPAASAAPALPDLGGTLVGLVAEIAQALGSYADLAPGAELSPGDPGSAAPVNPAELVAQPVADDAAPPPSVTDTPSPPPSAPAPVPPAALVTPEPVTPGPAMPPTPAPTELLAAERPPEPAVEVNPAPAPDVSSAQPAPIPEATAEAPQAARSAAVPAEKTPCEIAADELPKVGE